MNANSVSESIRSLYETYPYPSRIPGGTADPYLELIWSFSNKSRSGPRSFLDAGCGTGINAFGGAILYPHFQVYACDLNRVALEELRKDSQNLKLENLHLQEMDLLDLDPEFGPPEGFDIIFSTGVIHHTHDPVGVLKSLAQRLAPQGVLRLMVYGELGRSDLYRFARVARGLYGDETDWKTKVQLGKELLQDLEACGRYRDSYLPPVFRGPWEDAQRVDEVEFADRYLNPHDQPFSVPSLRKAINKAGLELLEWFEPRDWNLETLLPEFAKSDLAPTEAWKRYHLIEQLFDRPKLDLYLVKPEFEPRRSTLQQQTYLGLNPQLFLNCTKARGVSFHRVAQLRLGGETVLSRDEGTLLETFGLRFMTLEAIVAEMPNPSLEHWQPIVKKLLKQDFLFCPHPLAKL